MSLSSSVARRASTFLRLIVIDIEPGETRIFADCPCVPSSLTVKGAACLSASAGGRTRRSKTSRAEGLGLSSWILRAISTTSSCLCSTASASSAAACKSYLKKGRRSARRLRLSTPGENRPQPVAADTNYPRACPTINSMNVGQSPSGKSCPIPSISSRRASGTDLAVSTPASTRSRLSSFP